LAYGGQSGVVTHSSCRLAAQCEIILYSNSSVRSFCNRPIVIRTGPGIQQHSVRSFCIQPIVIRTGPDIEPVKCLVHSLIGSTGRTTGLIRFIYSNFYSDCATQPVKALVLVFSGRTVSSVLITMIRTSMFFSYSIYSMFGTHEFLVEFMETFILNNPTGHN
jgi:hypothetical protein